LNRIHIRRAKLLGLDAPAKLDIGAFYKKGGDELSGERLARQRVLEELPLEEQERIYEIFEAARKRAAGKFIETIATPIANGPAKPNDDDSESEV
jgi:hypothetical protein